MREISRRTGSDVTKKVPAVRILPDNAYNPTDEIPP
jgi:hypothetical protein